MREAARKTELVRVCSLVIAGFVAFALHAVPVRASEVRGIPALPAQIAAVEAALEVRPVGPLTSRLAFWESARGRRILSYDVDMTKRIHVIVVGDDLRTFLHLHPVLDDRGTFRIVVTVPKAGLYHVYADGDPHGYGHHVFRFDVPFGSATMTRGVLVRGVPTARTGPYEVTLDRTSVHAGSLASIAVAITKNGRPATDLHPYLGGLAHAVFVNAADLAYLHVHPVPAGSVAGMSGMSGMGMGNEMPMETLPDSAHIDSRMNLRAMLPSAGTYVLWLQFRGMQSIYVARFVITAHSHASSSRSLRSSASYAIVQVDYSGIETARLKEFEIPS
jgi:hypothetical protein